MEHLEPILEPVGAKHEFTMHYFTLSDSYLGIIYDSQSANMNMS